MWRILQILVSLFPGLSSRDPVLHVIPATPALGTRSGPRRHYPGKSPFRRLLTLPSGTPSGQFAAPPQSSAGNRLLCKVTPWLAYTHLQPPCNLRAFLNSLEKAKAVQSQTPQRLHPLHVCTRARKTPDCAHAPHLVS